MQNVRKEICKKCSVKKAASFNCAKSVKIDQMKFLCCVLCVKNKIKMSQRFRMFYVNVYVQADEYFKSKSYVEKFFSFMRFSPNAVNLQVFSQTTLNPISTLISSPTFYKRFICWNNSKSCRQSLSFLPPPRTCSTSKAIKHLFCTELS